MCTGLRTEADSGTCVSVGSGISIRPGCQ